MYHFYLVPNDTVGNCKYLLFWKFYFLCHQLIISIVVYFEASRCLKITGNSCWEDMFLRLCICYVNFSHNFLICKKRKKSEKWIRIKFHQIFGPFFARFQMFWYMKFQSRVSKTLSFGFLESLNFDNYRKLFSRNPWKSLTLIQTEFFFLVFQCNLN